MPNARFVGASKFRILHLLYLNLGFSLFLNLRSCPYLHLSAHQGDSAGCADLRTLRVTPAQIAVVGRLLERG
jgi:hypothetical protein